MKKIIACISLIFAMSAGVTALADGATYSHDDTNTLTMDATGYKTVLIEDASKNILYVDQNDSGLGSTVDFLLKGDKALEAGTYYVTLGGHDTANAAKSQFVVSYVETVSTEAVIMGKEVDKTTGKYAVGCKANAVLDNAAYVVLYVTNNDTLETGSISFSTGLTGLGSADIAIKVYDVPSKYEINKVGLSNVE